MSEPDDLARLADELDRSGADERAERLEEDSRKLSEHIGLPVETNYTGIVIPADADERSDGAWPNGEPFVTRGYWPK